MKAFLVLVVMGLILTANSALAGVAASAAPIAVGPSCSSAGSSTIQGTLLQLGPKGVTMTVDGGKGPLLAFAATKLLLPVASNVSMGGSPRSGDTVVVHAVSCPNAEKTVLTMVAASIQAKTPAKKGASK
jgi:hypothetical protein